MNIGQLSARSFLTCDSQDYMGGRHQGRFNHTLRLQEVWLQMNTHIEKLTNSLFDNFYL